MALASGDLSDSVFLAFRTVDERVREAGNFKLEDIGADHIRQASKPQSGSLAKAMDQVSEQEWPIYLAAGAFMSYKNIIYIAQ